LFSDEKDNQILRIYNDILFAERNEDKSTIYLNFAQICEKLDIVNMDVGMRISGHRAYFLKGFGVTLNIALMTYAMDFLESKGFTKMYVPHLMNEATME